MITSYRQLPAVDTLANAASELMQDANLPQHILIEAARTIVEQARTSIAQQGAAPDFQVLAQQTASTACTYLQPSLQPVINATGILLQTNLGRAPLSIAALDAMRRIGEGYSNLEFDLGSGTRGSRASHLGTLLCRLSGAEAAMVVNNNAAAILLVLSTFALGREVIVSRGQAVEIGGGFRIPDVLRQSGASLIEVGTTNRTYLQDYASAITERTALLLRVHTSNFRLLGFVHETVLAELATLGQQHAIPVLDDLGSGTLLSTAAYGLNHEPTVQESIAAGADLVTFSGDKLLGGPQAGLIVGRQNLIEQLKKHPLARALRVDKATLAGMEATLLAYLRGTAQQEIPIWRMISTGLSELQQRGERLVQLLGTTARLQASTSAIGGGSLPGATLASVSIHLISNTPDALAARLRSGRPAVVGRIEKGQLLLDLRSVLPEQDTQLLEAIAMVSNDGEG